MEYARKNTVKVRFGESSRSPTDAEMVSFVVRNLGVKPDQVTHLYHDPYEKCIVIKFTGETLMKMCLEQHVGERPFTYSNGSVTKVMITDGNEEINYVRLFYLPPEVPDKEIQAFLSKFGSVKRIVHEKRPMVSGFSCFSGVRGVYMDVQKEVPPQVYICNYRCRVYYSGMQEKCFICKATDHLKSDCPKRNGSQNQGESSGVKPVLCPRARVTAKEEAMAMNFTVLKSQRPAVENRGSDMDTDDGNNGAAKVNEESIVGEDGAKGTGVGAVGGATGVVAAAAGVGTNAKGDSIKDGWQSVKTKVSRHTAKGGGTNAEDMDTSPLPSLPSDDSMDENEVTPAKNPKITTPRCSLSLAKDIPDNEPVYLKHEGSSYKLWAPFGSSLVWNTTTEQTALLCSGEGNALEKNGQILSENTCAKGSSFNLAGDTYGAKELKCKQQVIGESSKNVEPCANGRGTMYRLGFTAGENEFLTYIESCFDTYRQSVLYTRHILPGGAIGSAVIADDFNNWRTNGMDDKVKPDTSYTQITQVQRLTTLLKTAEQAGKFVVEGKQYLTKGHLTPRGDGIFQTWKHATFFYVNAVPQWNEVNEGNWNNVEGRVRTIAALLREDVIVIQGSSGVLTLPDVSNVAIEISLEDAKIDVPLWTWKIVKSPSKEAGIAFVTLNNPHETKLSNEQLLCTNVCDRYGWTQKDYSDFKKGFTLCCDPNELIRMVPHAPNEGLVRTILTPEMLTSSGVSYGACISMVLIVLLIQLFM